MTFRALVSRLPTAVGGVRANLKTATATQCCARDRPGTLVGVSQAPELESRWRGRPLLAVRDAALVSLTVCRVETLVEII